MARWRTWLMAVAASLGLQATRVQAQGFTPPAPTPAPWTAPAPTPGDAGPTPIGPSTIGPSLVTPPGGGMMGPPGGGMIGPDGGLMGPGGGPGGFGGGPGLMPAGGPAAGPGGAPPSSPLQLTNSINAWDDDTPADAFPWSRYSSISVDLLILNTRLDRNPAYRSNAANTARGFNTASFALDNPQVIPRFNLDLRFGDFWGVRGSWMSWENSPGILSVRNANPNATIVGGAGVTGNFTVTQSDRLLINNVNVRPPFSNQFTAELPVQLSSPRAFWFLDRVPRQTLLNNLFGQPERALPPFTLQNAVQAGFPDTLTFESSFKAQRADLELTRYVELGGLTGVLGIGAMYGHVSHYYRATRVNSGGTTVIPGYDPFVLLNPPFQVFDANIRVNQDSESLVYAHTFGGTGPKLSFELGREITRFARLYSKMNGSILFGNRKEIAFYEARQDVQILDTERNPPADIFYNQTIAPQQVLNRNSFTVVPVGEAEAGIEIALGGRFFPVFKCGVFGQAWMNSGNATNPNANMFIYGINASLGLGF